MQVIRFTYNSTDIRLNIFLLLYFRMNGIFVYERFFDFGVSVQKRLLRELDDTNDMISAKVFEQYDMELFSIRDEQDFLEFRKYTCTEKALVLVSGNWKEEYQDELDKWTVVDCDGIEGEQLSLLLQKVIDAMWEKELISDKAYGALIRSAKAYCQQEIMKLSFKAKYFYTAEDGKKYKEIIEKYKEAYRALMNSLTDMENSWGNIETINLQYAVLNIAYEGTLYCRRNKKSFIFNPESIIRICNALLEESNVRMMFGESVYLLMAQVYDDLLRDTQRAYNCYLEACKDYNSYAYYKKAVHLMNIENDYKKALRYLKRSVTIYPSYDRAWYMLGCCYLKLERWEDAIKTFENVEVVLSGRLKAFQLRPMEIEYLFKALCQCGDIYYLKLHRISKALNRYLLAERIWDEIDSSKFLQEIGMTEEEQTAFFERIRKEQDIKRVYMRLTNVYKEIGDEEKVHQYFDKLAD